MIRASHGDGQEDRRPALYAGVWQDFLDLWIAYAQIERLPSTKEASPFISPFILRVGTVGKTLVNVDCCGAWFGLDVDEPGWTLDRLVDKFGAFPHFVHTTTTSTITEPRFRVNFQLSREIATHESTHLWHFFNDFLDGAVDRNTKNFNRLLYVPARWVGAYNAFNAQANGTPFDVDVALNWKLPAAVTPSFAGSASGITILQGDRSYQSDAELITPGMKQKFTEASEGGRFFRLLCDMAGRARRDGIALDANRALTEALQFDRMVTGKQRPNAEREARRALDWAQQNVQPEKEIDKIRNRLLFQQFYRAAVMKRSRQ